jgi:hypothetical protein
MTRRRSTDARSSSTDRRQRPQRRALNLLAPLRLHPLIFPTTRGCRAFPPRWRNPRMSEPTPPDPDTGARGQAGRPCRQASRRERREGTEGRARRSGCCREDRRRAAEAARRHQRRQPLRPREGAEGRAGRPGSRQQGERRSPALPDRRRDRHHRERRSDTHRLHQQHSAAPTDHHRADLRPGGRVLGGHVAGASRPAVDDRQTAIPVSMDIPAAGWVSEGPASSRSATARSASRR